jgi:hypothetical protein
MTNMNEEFVELSEDVSASPLWNPDLAPTTGFTKRAFCCTPELRRQKRVFDGNDGRPPRQPIARER